MSNVEISTSSKLIRVLQWSERELCGRVLNGWMQGDSKRGRRNENLVFEVKRSEEWGRGWQG